MSEKKHLSLDEITLKQWIILVLLSSVVGYLLACVVGAFFMVMKFDGEWSWLSSVLSTFVASAVLYLLFVVFLHKVCKTTVRELLVGDNNSIDWRQTVTVGGLYLVGFLIATFLLSGFGKNLSLNTASAGVILVNFVLAVVFTWMQTTWEEFLFRAIPLRWACGNNIRANKRAIVLSVVISALFMLAHFGNPEIVSQSGALDLACMALSYFLAGFVMYMADIAYGNMMPGCAIHWVNNFMAFAVINQVGTAVATQAIVIDSTSTAGVTSLALYVVAYLPLVIYTALMLKKRKAAKTEE